MDSVTIEITIKTYLTEMRSRLEQAASIVRAADAPLRDSDLICRALLSPIRSDDFDPDFAATLVNADVGLHHALASQHHATGPPNCPTENLEILGGELREKSL